MDERFRQIYAERALMGGIALPGGYGGFHVGGALAKGRKCRKGAVKVGPSGKKRCVKYKTLENSLPKKKAPAKKKAAPKRAPAKKKGMGLAGGFGVGGFGVGGCGNIEDMQMMQNMLSGRGGCGEMMGYGGAKKAPAKKAAPKAKVSAAKSDNPWIRYISCLAKVQGLKYGDALKYYGANKASLQPEYEWFKENEFKRCPKKKIEERRAYPTSPPKKKSPAKSTLGYEVVGDIMPISKKKRPKDMQFEFIDIPDEEKLAVELGKKIFGKKKAKSYVANVPTAMQGYRPDEDYIPREAFGTPRVPEMKFLNNPFNRFANDLMNKDLTSTYRGTRGMQYLEPTTEASSTRGMGRMRKPGSMHIR